VHTPVKFYTTSQDTGSTEPPTGFDLTIQNSLRCYPNPVQDYAIIEFENPINVRTRIDIYDLSGKHIICLSDGVVGKGIHRFIWKVNEQSYNLRKGIYICTIKAGDNRSSIKLLLE